MKHMEAGERCLFEKEKGTKVMLGGQEHLLFLDRTHDQFPASSAACYSTSPRTEIAISASTAANS